MLEPSQWSPSSTGQLHLLTEDYDAPESIKNSLQDVDRKFISVEHQIALLNKTDSSFGHVQALKLQYSIRLADIREAHLN